MQPQTTVKPPERRARSQHEIQHLMTSRTGALSLYSELASRRPFKPEQDTQQLLQDFCEMLVDYTATAHFQLYRHIDEERERRQAVLQVADEIYPTIAEITQTILDFNDKYDCSDHCSNLDELANDLSLIGERLADRIELEDRLIQVLTAPRSDN
jgi:regulator of sigma D